MNVMKRKARGGGRGGGKTEVPQGGGERCSLSIHYDYNVLIIDCGPCGEGEELEGHRQGAPDR